MSFFTLTSSASRNIVDLRRENRDLEEYVKKYVKKYEKKKTDDKTILSACQMLFNLQRLIVTNVLVTSNGECII